MKIIKNLSLIIVALCVSQFVFAATDSRFSLPVGSHSPSHPGEELTIYFDTLNPDIGNGGYDVHCNISANDFISAEMHIKSIGDSRYWMHFRLNGTDYQAGYPVSEVTFNPGLNSLDIMDVNSSNEAFTIYNNDWRQSIGALFSLEGECVSNPHLAKG